MEDLQWRRDRAAAAAAAAARKIRTVTSIMAFKETPIYLYSKPDIILVIGDSEFEIEAHEYTLASQSEFFKAALRSGLKESQERRITLPEITKNNMITILNWLYRVPLETYYAYNLHGKQPFSKETAQTLKDIMQTFDFLQIKGGGRDYCKFMEQSLKEIGFENTGTRLNAEDAESIVTQLNELYKSGASISPSAMDNLVDEITRIYKTTDAISLKFIEVFGKLSDPDGKCFRDISVAYARELHKKLGQRQNV
ncbi:hypothetical protein TWF225_007780 [Orbilia oligospora]|uniref:Uncharacterized protein n=1 Tax=Orbilia oligospora TaxID=2813651 RepID=A0A7C8PD73_ORBOL|nr:hypothetical protein TWF751_010678 [Orbilia oligospora]KAF3178752.1 hypothetical protein TWF225_007780 [Orbilia oligospora]KAF3235844.1 hypothetical protein TWF217_002857 [Orbilia oligospora]KAF3242089.1 hypothetical protein TWF128_010569 [Orbilia oligospora]TGJ65657.1 hypothetical protein EYR41_009609 [Orbilia oligospora]